MQEVSLDTRQDLGGHPVHIYQTPIETPAKQTPAKPVAVAQRGWATSPLGGHWVAEALENPS